MAKRSLFNLRIDVRQIEELAERLENADPEALAAALVATTNEQIDSVYELSRKRILSGINLTDPYLRERFEVREATSNRPSAEIIARARERGDYTLLTRYGMEVGSTKVKNPARSKGYAKLGIPKGKKQANPTVEVVRGDRKPVQSSKAFVFISEKTGKPILVKRKANGKLSSSLLGPSVYQLFRVAADAISDDVGETYRDAVIEAAVEHLEKVLT